LLGYEMKFDFTVSSTAEDLVKRMMQLGHAAYPGWVTAASYALIALTVLILSLIFSAALWFTFGLFMENIESTLVYLPAVLLSILISFNYITPRINGYFVRFMRFESDLDIMCHYQISAEGIILDEGDRLTTIKWSAISGVFSTRDLIVFHCRGLNYYIPKSVIGDKSQQSVVLETCSAWQEAAKSDKTAKVFV